MKTTIQLPENLVLECLHHPETGMGYHTVG
jgi:hypothetical protein